MGTCCSTLLHLAAGAPEINVRLASRCSAATQRPGKAQLVPIRIGDVEEALAPWRVAGLGIGRDPLGVGAAIEDRKTGGVVETERPRHVTRRQGDSADGCDHRRFPLCWPPRGLR